MSCYRYAAYGSNLHPGRLGERAPSATLVGTRFLPDLSLRFHKRSNNDGSGKCNIVAGGSGVFVAIYDIAEAERQDLDLCEGVEYGYHHEWIAVPEYGPCLTYVADSRAIDDALRPLDWYKEYVLRGARFHRFPADYVSALESVPADTDSDGLRSRREWELILNLDAE